ncbi:carbohydrate ABC transporter permease [Saccharothrix sp. Mg75]|uniref:carbohydrate ABC transporter permease n=1 Tax=Saccharothrix sp. Mg75 TaxID=3445357 RepID=UPI003EEC9913
MRAPEPPGARDAAQDPPGGAPPARPPRRPEQLTAWAFLTPLVLYLALFYAYPLLRNVDLSLRSYTVRSFVRGGAAFAGTANYGEVLANPAFGRALVTTVLFTAASLALQYGIGLALAVFFHRHFPLSATLRALFLVPWLLPLIVSASTWAWMLNSEAGVVNALVEALGFGQVGWLTSPGWSLVSVTVANTWIGVPFNLAILYSGLQAIPKEVHEAAALDGATGRQRFRHVTFPLLRPVSSITLLLGLVYTLKAFDVVWIMTKGGPSGSSTTLATWSYQLGFGSPLPRFGQGAAVGTVLILLTLVAAVAHLRARDRREDR